MANSFLGSSGIGKMASDWYKKNKPSTKSKKSTNPSVSLQGYSEKLRSKYSGSTPSYESPKVPSTSSAGRQYAQDKVAAITPKLSSSRSSTKSTGSNILGTNQSMGDLAKSIKPTKQKTANDWFKKGSLPVPKGMSESQYNLYKSLLSSDKVENQRLANQVSFNNKSSNSMGSSGSSSGSGGSSGSSRKIVPTIKYDSNPERKYGPNKDMTAEQYLMYSSELSPESDSGMDMGEDGITFEKDIKPINDAMNAIYMSARDDNLASIAALQSQFMADLANERTKIEKMFADMIGGVDPATQQALTRLQTDMDERQKGILEWLNRRGILQSGITAQELGKLAGSYNDKETEMLTGRVKELQSQLINQMWNFAQQRLNAMSGFNQNKIDQYNQYINNVNSGLENATNIAMEQYQQRQQNEREKNQQEQANFRAMIPYEYGPTPYQEGQLDIGKTNAATSAKNAQTTADRLAYEQQQSNLQNKVNIVKQDLQTLSPVDALKELASRMDEYIKYLGVDEYNKIYNAYKNIVS